MAAALTAGADAIVRFWALFVPRGVRLESDVHVGWVERIDTHHVVAPRCWDGGDSRYPQTRPRRRNGITTAEK
jgi:hypothetical protein